MQKSETTALREPMALMLIQKYRPYWHVILALSIVLFALAYAYIKLVPKKYQATASLIIKDEKKGNDDSRLLESLNLLGSKKIIENEIEVIRSRPVIESVVKKMGLYATLSIKKGWIKTVMDGYAPFRVVALDPISLKETQIPMRIQYRGHPDSLIIIDEKYPIRLNQWFRSQNGIIKLIPTNKKTDINKAASNYILDLHSVQSKTSEIIAALKITSSNKLSSVLELKYRDIHPHQAAHVLNEIIAAYHLASLDEKNALAQSTLQFIEQRLNDVEMQLTTIEKRIQDYRSSRGAIDIGKQGQLFLQNVSENDRRLSEVNLRLSVINQLESDLLSGEARAGMHMIVDPSDPVMTQMLTNLNNAEVEREKLRKTVGEGNPLMMAMDEQITKIRQNIRSSIGEQRKSLVTTRDNLSTVNTDYTKLLQTLPAKERELLEISRDQNIKSGIYAFLLQKREESELSYISKLPDSRVVNLAQSEPGPVSPKPLFVFGLAFMLSFGLPIGVIGARELLSSVILYRKDLEDLTIVPIIGEISFHKKTRPLAIETGKRSLVAEEFRRIRYALQDHLVNSGKKKILVTSSISGEGKSFVSTNLAISFSLSGKRTALIDFDLHNSSLEKIFSSQSKPGVSDYLSGEIRAKEIIYPIDGYTELMFIPSGTIKDDPSRLLETERLSMLMEYLDDNFDVLIIDSPPVGLVTDAYQLSNFCGVTVYAVRHSYTPKAVIRQIDQHNSINPLVSPMIVFNSVKNRGFGKSDLGYGYGYTAEYGRYYGKKD
ncbi:MAG: GumC family protein [Chitinophagaceae bacterium]|jgi:tyrosine-protein kinase Etk/Wzc